MCINFIVFIIINPTLHILVFCCHYWLTSYRHNCTKVKPQITWYCYYSSMGPIGQSEIHLTNLVPSDCRVSSSLRSCLLYSPLWMGSFSLFRPNSSDLLALFPLGNYNKMKRLKVLLYLYWLRVLYRLLQGHFYLLRKFIPLSRFWSLVDFHQTRQFV